MILVTGGSGYIGSHTILELVKYHSQIIVIDNFSTSSPVSLERVARVVGWEFVLTDDSCVARMVEKNCIYLIKGDISDELLLRKVFGNFEISSVIHFAGSKSVSESVSLPLTYYQNNVSNTLVLLGVMSEFRCRTFVFSSSASVYGNAESNPIIESSSLSPLSPYGRSKMMIEILLNDLFESDDTWSIAILRYFNPVGAHPSAIIGESPAEVPSNLFPYISKVAAGELEQLYIFGDDYNTRDGTGIRDYIHVVDLAKGHLCALDFLSANQSGCRTFNLGTGFGYSVLEIVREFEKASGQNISYSYAPRRDGDVEQCYANPDFALQKLGWEAAYTLTDMCSDLWRWQTQNPNGYEV